MKKLIILAGLPGTGKSTYANEMLLKGNTVIVSSDEVRYSITGDFSKMLDDMSVVYNGVCKIINEYFKENDDITIILDSTCLTDNRRNYFLERIVGADEVELIMLKVHDIQTVLKRNKLRIAQKWVPEDVILGMAKSYAAPSEENKNKYTVIKEVYVD